MKNDSSMFWLVLIVGIAGLLLAGIDYFKYNYSFSSPSYIFDIVLSLLLIVGAFYYNHKKAGGFS